MSFSSYKTFTTDHTQCGTVDSSNFVILALRILDVDFRTVGNGGFVQNSSGFDIRPYADSSLTVPLTYELVPGTYSGSNGIFEMHILVSTLDHSSDVVYYMAFGDASISTDGSSTSTWTSYACVQHFPAVSGSLSVVDSTGNASPTNNGATNAGGQIDGGAAFNGTTAYVDEGLPSALELYTDLTLSAWVVNTIQSGSNQFAYAKDFSTGARGYGMGLGSFTFYLEVNGAAAITGAGPTFTQNWFFIVATLTGGTWTGYVNASSIGTATPGSITANSSANAYVGGRSYAGFLNPWDGNIDEVRIAPTALSQSWITAQYNNQKLSSTFLTWGSRVPVTSNFLSRLPLMGAG